MKYAMILNPAAGRGKVGKLIPAITRSARRILRNIEVFQTDYRGHARELASQLANRSEVIIAVGGDGTVNEVVNGVIGSDSTLAVIPLGSGNDFIKNLNIPNNWENALEVIRENKVSTVDAGKINDYYFANGLGLGFDAHVVWESMKITRLRGFAIYLLAVLKALRYYRNQKIEFHSDGETGGKEIFMVSFGNGIAQGGGFYLTPEAKINDGLLDVCIIHALGRLEALLNLPKAIKGKHGALEQVKFLKVRTTTIYSEKGIGVHADGELISLNLKKVQVSIVPNALRVIHNGII